MQFNDFPLSEPLLRAVREEGFRSPTPLQRSAIPAVLEGRDILATAQTGTGKTAAYALPILERLSGAEAADHPRALVLAATRDVVLQIQETFETLGRHTPIKAVALVDSDATAAAQEDALREGRDVLIATPSRLLDLVDLGLARLHGIRWFVLDEVEDMDKLGLLGPAARAASLMNPRPQTLIFSAEITDHVRELAGELLDEPVALEAAPRALTVSHVDQRVIFTSRSSKGALLLKLLENPDTRRVLVYLRSRRAAQKLQRTLKGAGVDCELGRPARVQIVTDGNARRVKLNDLTHVINYDVPAEVEVYVHRVGRSVRAGSEAIAITLCDEEERATLTEIETTIRQPLTVLDNPLPPGEQASPEVAQRPPRETREPRDARPPREPRRDERPAAAPSREFSRDERPTRDSRPNADRPQRDDRRLERNRFYEDETPPAAVINFVSAPHPQVKKTIEEWFAEREERSPLEDAAVAAYIVEHPEFGPKKPAVKVARREGGRNERGEPRENRADNRGERPERTGEPSSNRKRRRVRGGQRRGGRKGPTNGAPNPSAPA